MAAESKDHKVSEAAKRRGVFWKWLANDVQIALLTGAVAAVVALLAYIMGVKDSQFNQLDGRLNKQSEEIASLKDQLAHAQSNIESYQVYVMHMTDHVVYIYQHAEDSTHDWQAAISKRTPAIEADSDKINLVVSPHRLAGP